MRVPSSAQRVDAERQAARSPPNVADTCSLKARGASAPSHDSSRLSAPAACWAVFSGQSMAS